MAAELARRRLSRVEGLTAWVIGTKDDGHGAGRCSDSTRVSGSFRDVAPTQKLFQTYI